jgi:hypothetical protein
MMAIDRIAWSQRTRSSVAPTDSVQAKQKSGVFDGRRGDRRAQEQRREPPFVHRKES